MVRDKNNIYMLRGPLLIATISLAAALPYIIQFIQSIISLESSAVLLLMLGASCCLAVHDMTRLVKIQAPRMVQKVLNRVILDDVLRSLYDPQQGFWAVLLGCSLGNAAMYTLPCSAEQRVEILQSNLECPHDQARVILQEPGGIRYLLPESFQQWLQQTKQNEEIIEKGEEHDESKENESHENDDAASDNSAAAAANAANAPLVKAEAALAACAAARIHMAAEESDDLRWIISSTASPAQTAVEANSCNSSLDDHSITHTAGVVATPLLAQQRVHAKREEPRSCVPRRIQATNRMNKRDALLQRQRREHRVPPQSNGGDTRETCSPANINNSNRTSNKGRDDDSNPSQATPPPPSPRLPHDILGSILMDMLRKSIQEHVPVHRVLETTSVLTALLLVMQHSQRARRICWRMLNASTTVSLSALLMGSVAALVSQQRTSVVPSSTTTTRTSVGSNTAAVGSYWLSKLNAIVRSCVNEAQRRRWKGLIAALVLFYFGKQRRRQRQGLKRRYN